MGLRLKVVFFFLIAIGTLIGASLWLTQIKLFSRSYHFQIAFEDVYGLKVNSRVQLLGVRIGRVTQIRLRPEVILVDVEINDPSIRIPIDSAFTIGSFATGGKYVDVIPVTTSLYAERTVGPGMTILGGSPTHLDTQFEKVQYQLSRMRSFLDDPQQQAFIEEQIQGVISLSRRFSSMADRTLAMTGGKRPQLDALDEQAARMAPAMVRQLEQLHRRAQGMLDTAEQLRLMGRNLGSRGGVMLARLHTLTGDAQGMLDRIERMGDIKGFNAKVRQSLANMHHLLADINTLLNLVKPSVASPAPVTPAAPGVRLPQVAQ